MNKKSSGQKSINLAIADDHNILRESLISCLQKEDPNLRFVLEAKDGQDLIDNISRSHAKILLLDISMPVLDGWQTLQLLNERHPHIKVIILSMHNSDYQIIKAIKLGARAVLTKTCDIETLIDAIYSVHVTGYYHDRKTSLALHHNTINSSLNIHDLKHSILTKREHQILGMICSGKTNQQISENLFLSVRTIESHRKSILEKTKSKNVAELIIYAIRNRLYDIENYEVHFNGTP